MTTPKKNCFNNKLKIKHLDKIQKHKRYFRMIIIIKKMNIWF